MIFFWTPFCFADLHIHLDTATAPSWLPLHCGMSWNQEVWGLRFQSSFLQACPETMSSKFCDILWILGFFFLLLQRILLEYWYRLCWILAPLDFIRQNFLQTCKKRELSATERFCHSKVVCVCVWGQRQKRTASPNREGQSIDKYSLLLNGEEMVLVIFGINGKSSEHLLFLLTNVLCWKTLNCFYFF